MRSRLTFETSPRFLQKSHSTTAVQALQPVNVLKAIGTILIARGIKPIPVDSKVNSASPVPIIHDPPPEGSASVEAASSPTPFSFSLGKMTTRKKNKMTNTVNTPRSKALDIHSPSISVSCIFLSSIHFDCFCPDRLLSFCQTTATRRQIDGRIDVTPWGRLRGE